MGNISKVLLPGSTSPMIIKDASAAASLANHNASNEAHPAIIGFINQAMETVQSDYAKKNYVLNAIDAAIGAAMEDSY